MLLEMEFIIAIGDQELKIQKLDFGSKNFGLNHLLLYWYSWVIFKINFIVIEFLENNHTTTHKFFEFLLQIVYTKFY